MMCNFNLMWQAPFLPNLLNSTVFLVETSQMISVFFANYEVPPPDHPFQHLTSSSIYRS